MLNALPTIAEPNASANIPPAVPQSDISSDKANPAPDAVGEEIIRAPSSRHTAVARNN
jgi:hypothetical protein